MKKWFNKLKEQTKKIIVWSTWIVFIISFIVFGFVSEGGYSNTILDDLFLLLCIISLIFAIMFTIWKVKNRDNKQITSSNILREINDQNIDTINYSKQDKDKVTESNNQDLFKNINLTFVDVETPNRSNNRICSIALINIANGKTNYKQTIYVNPEARFDEINMQIHGINPKMVENAPKFNEVWNDISKYFLNTIVVGHGVKSDLAIISKTLKHYGLSLNTVSFIDTLNLSKKYISAKSYKLSELTKEFAYQGQAHDALSDCIDCENLLTKIVQENNLSLYSETEEYYIQHEIVEEPKAFTKIKNTKETVAYQNLQITISKIMSDNNVTEDELKSFIDEVEANNLQETYPIDKAYKIASEKLKNNSIDIKESLSTITGKIDNDKFDGFFEGKLFCLTGDFNHGSKNEIADYIISKGGFVKDNLTLKVDYLVRGLQGSESYAYGSYGSKVKKALEMKEKESNIKIITEDDIY